MFCRLALLVISLNLGLGPHVLASDPPSPIRQTMQRFVDDKTIAGAVTLVAVNGEIMSIEAVGMSDLETKRQMTLDTLFWIASMTKPITATAMMTLVDEGKVSLDAPAGEFIPEFNSIKLTNGQAPTNPVTIRHLLSHTSGVGGPKQSPSPTASLAETAVAIASSPLQFEPGSQWKYGNGLTVTGRIIEIVSKQTFEDFVAQQIFQPLKMNDTSFDPSSEQRQRLATIYATDMSNELTPSKPPVWINFDPAGPRGTPNPSGGLASTANDYFLFLQMILNGGKLVEQRILSEKAVAEMLRPQTGDMKAGFVPGSQWGLGWGLVQRPEGVTAALSMGSFGHGGAFGTQAWADRKQRAIYIMLIQRTGLPNSDGSALREAFQNIASQNLGSQSSF